MAKTNNLTCLKTYEQIQRYEVAIHYHERKKNPFGKLISRNSVAIVFSFFGDKDEVHDFMQTASHLTRVYFINENRLKGFLVSAIISSIKKAISWKAISRGNLYDAE